MRQYFISFPTVGPAGGEYSHVIHSHASVSFTESVYNSRIGLDLRVAACTQCHRRCIFRAWIPITQFAVVNAYR